MGGQPEGMHLVSERAEGRISSQAVGSSCIEKAMPEELSVTLSDKKGCFACNERSHNLDQCEIKYKLVSAAHQFGYATKFPFTVFQPSEMVEKKKFYRHCVLIKCNVTNLDKGILKDKLNMFWKLSGDWKLRRECNMTFMASFSSEDDVISCLKNPKFETLLHNKEVQLTVKRWKESDDGSLDLIEEWLLVCGIPRIYRNWKELYQVASAFGVLMDVDEESLEVGDKESIRLKTAFRSFDGAPFSYYFAFGWPSKLIMVTVVVQDKTEGMKHKNKELDKEHKKELHAAKSILLEEPKRIEESRSNGKAKEKKISSPGAKMINSEITITESSKPISPSSRSMIEEEHLRGIQKPKGIAESRSNGKAKENKISAPTATITNSEETATKSIVVEQPKGIEESRSDGKAKENKISAPAATMTNSKKTATESSKPEGVQSICPSPPSKIREEHFKGSAPIKLAFKGKGKKQQVTESINKSPSNKMDKEVAPHSSSNATRTGASTGCDMLDQKYCAKMEPKRKLNLEEITLVGESKKAKKLGACRDTEYNNVAAPTINSKKTQILGETSRKRRDELITKHTKAVGMDQMGSGVQGHKKGDAPKMDTRLLPSSEEVVIYDSFTEMGLQENLLRGIYKYGLEKPSVVHQRGIVPLCKGFGVIHQSLSGTTETICTGVLQQLDYGSAECQALILVPTPDLAQETVKNIGALGQFLGVTAQTCTGGTSADADQQTMTRRVQVLVGTPDCILDVLQRHALSSDHIRMLFLDEADELLTGGSKDQVSNIILHLPKKIQVGLFSAIYSNEGRQASYRLFMDEPMEVIVPRDEELKSVKQFCITVENEELKLEKLYDICKFIGAERRLIIIYVNTEDKAVSLAKDVGKHYTVSASHDGMDQCARATAIQELRSGSSNILITTDHGGTSSIPQVPIIINYDIPTESMRYVRRLQQRNRQFRQPLSVVINLITPATRRTLAAITRFCNTYVGEVPSDLKI